MSSVSNTQSACWFTDMRSEARLKMLLQSVTVLERDTSVLQLVRFAALDTDDGSARQAADAYLSVSILQGRLRPARLVLRCRWAKQTVPRNK